MKTLFLILFLLIPVQCFSAQQSSYPDKATPVDADKVLISDSEDSWKSKNVPMADLINGIAINLSVDDTTLIQTGESPNYTLSVKPDVFEADLGNPSTNGYVLSSTTGGTRSWIAPGGGVVAIADLSDWPSGLTATELGYVDGATSSLQDQINSLSAGGVTISTATPTTPGAVYLNDTTHVLSVASSTGVATYSSDSFTLWDTEPAAFSFTDLTDVALSTTQTATPVQIAGINYPAAVTSTGGNAAICTGDTVGTCGSFSTSPGNITNNQYVSAQHTSSSSASTAVNTVVTVGGSVNDTFTSTTAGSISYIYEQDFEGVGAPSYLYLDTPANFDFDDSTAIEGSESVRVHYTTATGTLVVMPNTPPATASEYYYGFAARFTSFPTGDQNIFKIFTSSGVLSEVTLRISSSGIPMYYLSQTEDGALYLGSGGAALSLNTWYYFKLYRKASTGLNVADGVATIWVSTDGSTWTTRGTNSVVKQDAVLGAMPAIYGQPGLEWRVDDIRISGTNFNF